MKFNQTSVEVSYTENDITQKAYATNFDVVIRKQIESITATILSTTPQAEGRPLNTEGLVVKAKFNDSEIPVLLTSGYTIIGGDSLKEGINEITVKYVYTHPETNEKKEVSTTFFVNAAKKVPVSITVTKEPIQKEYTEGNTFNPNGMELEILYSNGEKEKITDPRDYQIEGKELQLGQTKIKIIYAEEGSTPVEKEYEIPGLKINPKVLQGITVDATECKKVYTEGDSFDVSKLKGTAVYNDGKPAQEITSGFVVNDGKPLTKGQTSVVVKYTAGGVTKTDVITGITVNAKVLVVKGIAIDSSEVKKAYIEGETFDKSKLKVYEVYEDDTRKEVKNYTVTGGNNMPAGRKSVTISYTAESGETFTESIAITVSAKELVSIAITNPPTKVKYVEGDSFDKTGMEITATYNNNTTDKVTKYTVLNGNKLAAGQTSVTISYKEGTKTATAEFKGLTVEKKAPQNPIKDVSKYGFLTSSGPIK